MKKEIKETGDIYECRRKIKELLSEYNCSLISFDDYHSALLYDNDTEEQTNV